MSLEIVLAISEISNRKYVIPPAIYIDGICHWKDKTKYIKLFDIYEEDAFRSIFNCVDYTDVYDPHVVGGQTYYSNIHKVANIQIYDNNYKVLFPLKDGMHFVTINDINSITDLEDYKKFSNNRPFFDVDRKEKFIHFPRNLFGHFYYCVYANKSKRNSIREKILKGFKFKNAFYNDINGILKELGAFNAIHIRRGDFQRTRPNMFKTLSQIPEFLDMNLENKKLPIYIATDEKDKSVFDDIKRLYKVYFLDDFIEKTSKLRATIYDQLIPSYAEQFLGSGMSTYSDYINVNRVSLGKPVNTRLGSNYRKKELIYKSFPWEAESYGWDNLYSYYWEKE